MLIAFKGSATGRRERLCGSGLLLWKSAAVDDRRDGLPASLSQDGAQLITSDCDPADALFLTGERTVEGGTPED
jgi:hypothetical protein